MATNPRQAAHELIDQMAERYVAALVPLLEAMLDPASQAIANAPVDDEPESESERVAVAASKAWMAENPGQGISGYDLLTEFGVGMKETA